MRERFEGRIIIGQDSSVGAGSDHGVVGQELLRGRQKFVPLVPPLPLLVARLGTEATADQFRCESLHLRRVIEFPSEKLEVHLDTDEGNGVDLTNATKVHLKK